MEFEIKIKFESACFIIARIEREENVFKWVITKANLPEIKSKNIFARDTDAFDDLLSYLEFEWEVKVKYLQFPPGHPEDKKTRCLYCPSADFHCYGIREEERRAVNDCQAKALGLMCPLASNMPD